MKVPVVPFPAITEEIHSLSELSPRWSIVARQYFGTWRRNRAFQGQAYGARGPMLEWQWNLGPKDLVDFRRDQLRGLIATVRRREGTVLILYARIPQLRIATTRDKSLDPQSPHSNRIRSSSRG